VLAYAIVLVASFLVTWVVTDVLHVPRTPYVAILAVVSLGLGGAYLVWSGTSVADVLVRNGGWALLAGVVVALVLTPAVRRLPGSERPAGSLAGHLVWEGGVYGIAEALLLSALPVLAVWQAADGLGWTRSTWGDVGSGALAIVGALFVILVHHLGYREFRPASARPMLMGALLACGVQALAFLLTGNILAPVLAHVALHVQMLGRGVELPPAARRGPASPVARELPAGHDRILRDPDIQTDVTAVMTGSQTSRRRVRG
jgi:hypothetical protein